jgi:hypothetical protein
LIWGLGFNAGLGGSLTPGLWIAVRRPSCDVACPAGD